MSNNNKSTDSGGLGCAFMLMMAVVAMPLLGLYPIAAGEEDEQRSLGVAL